MVLESCINMYASRLKKLQLSALCFWLTTSCPSDCLIALTDLHPTATQAFLETQHISNAITRMGNLLSNLRRWLRPKSPKAIVKRRLRKLYRILKNMFIMSSKAGRLIPRLFCLTSADMPDKITQMSTVGPVEVFESGSMTPRMRTSTWRMGIMSN